MTDLVEITCCGKTETLERSNALEKYFECMMCSEGSERDRYTNIYIDLKTGKKRCTDE